MIEEIGKIKKIYGEKMSHFCRDNFSTILENPGVLLSILDAHFPHDKELINDVIDNHLQGDFIDFVYSKANLSINTQASMKSPFELMDEAGYKLYECKSERDIQLFKKYYAQDEKLCTFNGNRLERCYVFFAVKKNVDNIKRENYLVPERENEYGTSVISIQFSRGEHNIISIKNRYNHTVDNPDATFSNNLDNIIPGLTDSFEKKYHFNLEYNKNHFELPNYVLANDGRYYKYNFERNGICYCSNNIIIDNGKIIRDYCDKSKYIFLDDYILDVNKKEIIRYRIHYSDGFIELLANIKDISIRKVDNTKVINIFSLNGNTEIIIDQKGSIKSLVNNNVTVIEDSFLENSEKIERIELNNVREIKDLFLPEAKMLHSIQIPNVEVIGNCFLKYNERLKYFNADKLTKIRGYFLYNNKEMESLSLPSLTYMGSFGLFENVILKTLNLPNLTSLNSFCFNNNNALNEFSMPSLVSIGDGVLYNNRSICKLYLPKVVTIGNRFLYENSILTEVDLPKVYDIMDDFLPQAHVVKRFNAPHLHFVGDNFLVYNFSITDLSLPELEKVGKNFLANDHILYNVYLPNLKEDSYSNNNILKRIKKISV